MSAQHSVRATLNYVDEIPAEKPAVYIRPRRPGDDRKGPVFGAHEVDIEDARGEGPSLESEGVELVVHDHAFDDFYDAEAVRTTYYPEVERLVAAHTGATRVLAFDHNLRSQALAEDVADIEVKLSNNVGKELQIMLHAFVVEA